MSKKVLIVDIDDTVAKLEKGWLKAIGDGTGEYQNNFLAWDVAKQFKCGNKVYSYLDYDLFRNLEVVEYSREVLTKLSEVYEVYFATSAVQNRASLLAKLEWIEEHFPFIPLDNLILCGNKKQIKGDIMIDDGSHNLKYFEGRKLLFDCHHNRNDNDFERVLNWKEIEKLLL